MHLLRSIVLLACITLATPSARAELKLHQLFGDHMVLQHGVETNVWGTAAASTDVTVTLVKGDSSQVVVAKSNEKGEFKAKLPATIAGVGYTITVSAGDDKTKLEDIAFGEVWVCSGQSNMEWRFNLLRGGKALAEQAVNKNIRLFTVPKTPAKEPQSGIAKGAPYETKWLESNGESVFTFSAVGYYFGTTIQKALDVPVGLIHSSWGGTPAESWASKEKLESISEIKYYLDKKASMVQQAGMNRLNPHTPTSLYNGMIHPLLNYPIKGAIWYQGESNANRAAEYRTLFPAMIEDWRKAWGVADLPFFLVQLAPFHAGDADGVQYAELRDAQRLATTKLKNVGMAVITDVGDLFDIHPQQKQPAGERLAAAALNMVYGKKNVPNGPVYKSMTVDGEKAVLTFDVLGGGLVAKGSGAGTVNGFTICGEDKYFYPAKAVIKGDTVLVSCEKVSKPIAVRFGWSNYPLCNLFNKAGIPASPFRTDDFPLTTEGKR
jgi:sialate O-acetylesterase